MATLRRPGITGGKNEETGEVDVTVSHFVSTESEILTVGDASFWGVPLLDRKFGNWEPDTDTAGFQVDLQYRGVRPEDEESIGEVWTFDDTFREVPVEQHPDLDNLLEEYGGVIIDGKVEWIDNFQFGSGVDIGLRVSGNEASSSATRHPFSGEDSILVFYSVATREYFTKNLSSAYRGVGEIYAQLPGDGPRITWEHGQNWIKRMPRPRTSGDGWMVSEDYWSSAPGGWKEGLHNLIVK